MKQISLISLLAIVTLLTACSLTDQRHFRRHIQQFESDFNTEVDTTFKFATSKHIHLSEDDDARCVGFTDTILIKERVWRGYTYGQQWALVYHELGHCHYAMDHYSETTTIGSNPEIVCPVSLMNSEVYAPECYESRVRRDMYVDRMWQRPQVKR